MNGTHAEAVGVKKNENGEEGSSAEESRMGTTRKRTIIDPFEVTGKKRKRRRKETVEIKKATDGTAQEGSQMAGERATDDIFDTTAGPSPKKKKRKKRKILLPEGQEADERNGEARAITIHKSIAAHNEGAFSQSPLDTLEGMKPLRQEFRDGASDASDTCMSWLVLQRSRTESDQHLVAAPGSVVSSPTSPIPSLPCLPIPRSPTGAICTENAVLPFPTILNLTGPPSIAPEGTESHSRKKRRRRRKKKALAGDPP